MLALLSATALSLSSRSGRPKLLEAGSRRLVLLAVAVVTVVFARLLGHQYGALYWAAWVCVVVATIYACHPRERSGSRPSFFCRCLRFLLWERNSSSGQGLTRLDRC